MTLWRVWPHPPRADSTSRGRLLESVFVESPRCTSDVLERGARRIGVAPHQVSTVPVGSEAEAEIFRLVDRVGTVLASWQSFDPPLSRLPNFTDREFELYAVFTDRWRLHWRSDQRAVAMPTPWLPWEDVSPLWLRDEGLIVVVDRALV